MAVLEEIAKFIDDRTNLSFSQGEKLMEEED